MAYNDVEASRYDSAPVELLELISSDGNEFRYTSGAVKVVFGGYTYLPLAGLTRGDISTSAHTDDHSDIDIEFPLSAQIVALYAANDSPPDIKVKITRLQRDTLDSHVIFDGDVSKISIGDDALTFKCESSAARILSIAIPSIIVQSPCNHSLFDSGCKIVRELYTIETTVAVVNRREIQIASLGGKPEGFFQGGEMFIPATGERRSIVDQAGLVFQINFEFREIGAGTTVVLTAGCDMSYSSPNGCSKFSNWLNFGGFPFVPGESNNVFSKGL